MISRVNFEFRISIFDLAGDSYLGSWPPGPSFLRERNAIETSGIFGMLVLFLDRNLPLAFGRDLILGHAGL